MRRGFSVAVAYQQFTGPVDAYVLPAPQATTPYTIPPDSAFQSAASQALYLGTCEQYPAVRGGQNWNPWFADQTGNMEPAEWEYQNEWKVIGLDLNKFRQSAVNAIKGTGSTGRNTIGKLLQGNLLYFYLWLRFQNFTAHPDLAALWNLPPGEFYPCCRILENNWPQVGTKNRTTQLMIRTSPLLDITTPSPGSTGNNRGQSPGQPGGVLQATFTASPPNDNTLVYNTLFYALLPPPDGPTGN